MSEPFLGEIRMFGGNFNPRGWALCNGQLLSIAQNTALFSILGTTYGGNGQSTFGLPDLRGRRPIHWGQGPGLGLYDLGEVGGVEAVTLISTQMPAHIHTAALAANNGAGNDTLPTGNFLASDNQYNSAQNTQMNAGSVTIGPAGNNQPHENRAPFLCVTFIIALEGIFPSRN